jgi:hypothetical protein
MAQFEAYSLEDDCKFFNKTVISYMKLLLLPMRIWQFGYHDGLSIDCKMKMVYAVIGKLGGSGGNAEEAAIKGILRSVALWPVIEELKKQDQLKSYMIHFKCSDHICYRKPVFQHQAQQLYMEVLRYMFGGDIGAVLNRAFSKYGTGVAINGIDLDDLQFYEKLTNCDSSASKYLGTYIYDWFHARKCLRNNVSQPRLSSTAIVTVLPQKSQYAIRIQVLWPVCFCFIF